MKLKIGFVIISIIANVTVAFGQYYSVGSEPAGIKWRQLDGVHYKIIYPQEIDSLARRYLYKMELMRPLVMEPLMIDPIKQPVILHAHSTISNGSVAVAPTRVDLFTNPDAYNVIPMSWIDCLVTHELRHTGQDEHFMKGLYHPLSYLFGEQIAGAGMGLFITSHELEGDAVVAETELSQSGRGRQADFVQHARTLFLNGEYRNYKRMKFGSFYKETPNKYVLGYLCEVASRVDTEDYFYMGKRFDATARGFQVIKDIFQKPDERPFESWADIYGKATTLFTEVWEEDAILRAPYTSLSNILAKENKYYCDYLDAIHIDDLQSPLDGYVITVKKGLHYAPELIGIDKEGKEHHLGYFSSYASSLSNPVNGRIYWSETIYHNAATLQNYSVVRYYDYRDKTFGTLGRNTKYFNPAPNNKGDRIVVAEYPIEGTSFLVLLDNCGNVINSVESPKGGQILESAFVGEDIYCTVLFESGVSVYRYDNREWSEILTPQHISISSLKSNGEFLYFSSDVDGLNNIYSYYPDQDVLMAISNSQYGAKYPYVIGGDIYYSDFSLNGYRPVRTELKNAVGKELTFSQSDYPFIDVLEKQRVSQSVATMDSSAVKYLDAKETPSKRYSQLGHMIHIHSWAPVYYNIDNILSANFDQLYSVAAPGVTLYSQNEIGNIETMFGYSYHDNRHAGHFKSTAHIMNMSFELSADYNDRTRRDNEHDSTFVSEIGFLNIGLKAYKQIHFNQGGWNRTLTPIVQYNFSNDTFFGQRVGKVKTGLTYSQTLPIAKGQIFPRWGFGVNASITQGISKLNSVPMNYTYSFLYLPGFTHNQGLKLTSTYQWHRDGEKQIRLSSIATLPRGYKELTPSDRFFKITADYALSIYAGDLDLKLIYLQRFQLIPFVDYAIDYNASKSSRTQHYSYGTDFMIDFHLFEFMPNFQAGVRYSRTPLIGDKNHFEMLFSVDI